MKTIKLITALFAGVLALGQGQSWAAAPPAASADEARAIAQEAHIYGFPMVDGYRVMYTYCEDRENPEFKAPWNQLRNIPRVFTSDDRAIVAPNSDTPYSMACLVLRDEPMVLTVPEIEPERYFSIQLIDAFTHNFDYIGSRTTGNGGGTFLIAGPGWEGETPDGIDKVFRSETDLVFAVYRTQLFNPDDLENVKRVQDGYQVKPLSAFLGMPAPAAGEPIAFMPPLSIEEQRTSPEFFNVLNFVLEFAPTHPSEIQLMERFAKIGVGAGKRIDVEALAPEMREALVAGMADAWDTFNTFNTTHLETNKVTSGDLFGTREFLANNYLYRFVAAVIGLYGNSAAEAIYPFYRADADGNPLDASQHNYILRFAPGQLPPVNAFWSVTMYGLPENLLVANPLNRYLINSPMLPDLKRDEDGGLTIYIQAESPGPELESNWLPAPNGPFWIAMRLYWPKDEALDGTWQQPPLVRAQNAPTTPAVLGDGAGAQYMRVDNMHQVRYIELFLAGRDAVTGNIVAAVYNSMFTPAGIPASRDTAPQALVEGLDFEQMKKDYGLLGASLNGPKLWLPDWTEVDAGKVRDFNGISAAWVAQVNMGSRGAIADSEPYRPTTIARKSGVGWNKGTTVLLLDDAEGNTWVMKGFQLGLEPRHTYEEFVAAGQANFKNLPEGWSFRVKTLEKDLIEIPEGGVATIMPDEFFNVYDKTGPGMTNYQP